MNVTTEHTPSFVAAYRVGTPLAMDYGNADTCTHCGRRLRDVVMTTIGALGRDCYATLSGDHSTRPLLERVAKNGHGGDRTIVTAYRTPNAVWFDVATSGSGRTVLRVRPGSVSERALDWWTSVHAADARERSAVPPAFIRGMA